MAPSLETGNDGQGLRSAPAHVWALPAAATLLASLLAIGHQVLWQDELATYTAATRSFGELIDLAKERDAVLAAYYALMNLWTDVFGASPESLRIPSALAMATAAAVTARIGARLFGSDAGLVAGLLLALLPAISEYGQEARPYAFAVLGAAVATLMLLRALEDPRSVRWILYALSLSALGAVQLTAVLIALAHAVAVGASWRQTHDRRLVGWLIACVAAVVAVTPILLLASRQTQLSGVAETTWTAIGALPGELFGEAFVAGAVIGLGLLAPFRGRGASLLCLLIALVPVVLILLISIEQPLLRPRYLLPTLLGWSLLAGATLARYGRYKTAVLLLVLLALGMPKQLDLRSKTLNASQPNYEAIAAIMSDEVRDGDAIVLPSERGVRFRIGLEAYLPARNAPHDVLATRTPAAAASLDSWECIPATCIGTPARLWVGCDRSCDDPLSGLKPETAEIIQRQGYFPLRIWQVEGGAISLYSPAPDRGMRSGR